jgi:hypothetical protein
MKRNVIGSQGGMAFALALPCNHTLRVLELEATQLQSEDATAIFRALHNNNTVHALNLNDNPIGDDAVAALASLLPGNNVLNTMGLRHTGITYRGCAVVADALKANSKLTGIDLGRNWIGTKGANAFAECLGTNCTLTSLDINNNQIDSPGIQSLAFVLMMNTALKHLDITCNNCRDAGAAALAEMIEKNSTLTRLSVTSNEITNRGGQDLLRALASNRSLCFLKFGGQSDADDMANQFSLPTRNVLKRHISRNKAFADWQTSITNQPNTHSSMSPSTPTSQDGTWSPADRSPGASPSSSVLSPNRAFVRVDTPTVGYDNGHSRNARAPPKSQPPLQNTQKFSRLPQPALPMSFPTPCAGYRRPGTSKAPTQHPDVVSFHRYQNGGSIPNVSSRHAEVFPNPVNSDAASNCRFGIYPTLRAPNLSHPACVNNQAKLSSAVTRSGRISRPLYSEAVLDCANPLHLQTDTASPSDSVMKPSPEDWAPLIEFREEHPLNGQSPSLFPTRLERYLRGPSVGTPAVL